MQFMLTPANDSSEKIARNIPEYRSCQFTASDEQFRMVSVQIELWSLYLNPPPYACDASSHTYFLHLRRSFECNLYVY